MGEDFENPRHIGCSGGLKRNLASPLMILTCFPIYTLRVSTRTRKFLLLVFWISILEPTKLKLVGLYKVQNFWTQCVNVIWYKFVSRRPLEFGWRVARWKVSLTFRPLWSVTFGRSIPFPMQIQPADINCAWRVGRWLFPGGIWKETIRAYHSNFTDEVYCNVDFRLIYFDNYLRHCVTSRKVAGSIPNGVIRICD